MEVYNYDIDIDRWKVHNFAKNGGWANIGLPETVNTIVQYLVGSRKLSASGRYALETAIKDLLHKLAQR